MKIAPLSIILAIPLTLCSVSCKKGQTAGTPPARNVKFVLYTTHDFGTSGDEMIDFTLMIHSRDKALWDSVLPPMKIKDIPNAANKLVVEKQIPDNYNGALALEFQYAIEGVGVSWSLDSAAAGETFKEFDFDFN